MVRVDPFQFFGKALRPGPGFSQIRLVQLKPLEELGAKLPSVVNPLMNLQVWRFILPVSGDSVFCLNIGFTTLQEIYSLQL